MLHHMRDRQRAQNIQSNKLLVGKKAVFYFMKKNYVDSLANPVYMLKRPGINAEAELVTGDQIWTLLLTSYVILSKFCNLSELKRCSHMSYKAAVELNETQVQGSANLFLEGKIVNILGFVS